MDLTEQQAREEFRKLSLEDLRALAEQEGKPTEGMSANDLIELLLGNCPGCGKGRMTLIVISSKRKTIIQQQTKIPCLTGGCK